MGEIPGFESDGTLPPGTYFDTFEDIAVWCGHATTLDEVEDRFVSRYPDSATRSVLFKELTHYVRVLQRYTECVTVYVGGAFATDREDPTDILIVFDIPVADMTHVDGLDFWLLSRLFDGRSAKITDADLTIDVEMIEGYAPEHPMYPAAETDRRRAMYMLGRPVPGKDAGGHLSIFDCHDREAVTA